MAKFLYLIGFLVAFFSASSTLYGENRETFELRKLNLEPKGSFAIGDTGLSVDGRTIIRALLAYESYIGRYYLVLIDSDGKYQMPRLEKLMDNPQLRYPGRDMDREPQIVDIDSKPVELRIQHSIWINAGSAFYFPPENPQDLEGQQRGHRVDINRDDGPYLLIEGVKIPLKRDDVEKTREIIAALKDPNPSSCEVELSPAL